MTFLETPRFNDDIAYGSKGGPGFKTWVFEGHSGLEQREIAWSRCKGRWDVSYGVRDTADMDLVRALFYATRGRAHSFRFKDWHDYSITNGVLGTGDGATTVYRISKIYTAGALSYSRRIFKPVSGTAVVKKDGVTQTLTTHYTIDYTTGTITFVTAPGNGTALTVTCDFDVPVRFDTDELQATHDGHQTETWDSIPIVELLLEEA